MENCFYSSDDELAWGPLTLTEIKKEFQEKPKIRITRRETDFGHSTFFTPSTTFCDDNNQPTDKVSNSSGTSAYFTPDESVNHAEKPTVSRNDEFLKNLSAAIESTDDTASQVPVNSKRDTLMNILERQKEKECDLLEGIQQTLVENTLQHIEDAITEEPSISHDSSVDIIVISDDSSSESEEEIIFEPVVTYVKSEQPDSNESDLLEIVEEISEKSNSTDYNEDQLNISQDSHANPRISDEYINNTDNLSIEENIEKINNMNLNDEPLNISGVSHFSTESEQCEDGPYLEHKSEAPNIPKLLVSRDEDSEQCDPAVFNDTIEEMEMALMEGLSYMAPEDNSMESSCASEPKPSAIPKLKKIHKTPNKFDYVQSPIGDYIRNRSPNRDNFKLPLKPVKTKLFTPNAKATNQTKQFKSIVSPVSVYIKNSPRPVLKQNLPVKTIATLKSPAKSDIIISNNDNIVIPEVVYKPGKKIVTSVKKDVVLPSSLQKMVQEPVIIQHECRTQGKSNAEIAKKLEDGDLTVDSSMLNQTEVSYINIKQAFIK